MPWASVVGAPRWGRVPRAVGSRAAAGWAASPARDRPSTPCGWTRPDCLVQPVRAGQTDKRTSVTHKGVTTKKKRKCAFKVHLHWTVAKSMILFILSCGNDQRFFLCFRVRFHSVQILYTLYTCWKCRRNENFLWALPLINMNSNLDFSKNQSRSDVDFVFDFSQCKWALTRPYRTKSADHYNSSLQISVVRQIPDIFNEMLSYSNLCHFKYYEL